MKMPDPVAWLDVVMQAAYTVDELADAEGTGFEPLFTEAQLREALAQQEAVMRMALEAFREVAEWESEGDPLHPASEAIKALEEQLK